MKLEREPDSNEIEEMEEEVEEYAVTDPLLSSNSMQVFLADFHLLCLINGMLLTFLSKIILIVRLNKLLKLLQQKVQCMQIWIQVTHCAHQARW